MHMKQKVVKVNRKLADKFSAEGGRRSEGARGGARDGEIIDVSVRIGESLCSAFQSGISHLYRQCGIEQNAHAKTGISLYCKG